MLDAEEQALLDAFEAGELKSIAVQSQLGKIQSGCECDVHQGQTDQHSIVNARLNGYSSASVRRRLALPNIHCQHLAQIRFGTFARETIKFGEKLSVNQFYIRNWPIACLFIA